MQSHFRPRTRDGWIATVLFVALFLLSQPPVIHRFANRIEPRLAGMPFLYVWLSVVYAALIGVLLWIQRRRI